VIIVVVGTVCGAEVVLICIIIRVASTSSRRPQRRSRRPALRKPANFNPRFVQSYSRGYYRPYNF